MLVAFKRVYASYRAASLAFEFQTDCAGIRDTSSMLVTDAAGFIGVSGDAELDLAVGRWAWSARVVSTSRCSSTPRLPTSAVTATSSVPSPCVAEPRVDRSPAGPGQLPVSQPW
ncbi:hypothetical protein DB30_05369 [Enhygromyxa salina]|uniref:Uncharacterized protein n=1 Tax=Enhygromyxa salina TaxID=215803 RepID=A0A0C2CX67_9BACT|nr:hypothetical protein DB30_05369 [Enhygromyxa salina]